MDKSVRNWQLFGAVFIIVMGSIFHFLYEWMGNWAPIGSIAAVNESVWEHLKLSYWPLIFYSIFEYRYIKDKANNVLIAKTVAAYIIPTLTVVFFYSYTIVFRVELLIVDIISFYIFILIGQYISYKIMKAAQISKKFSYIALISIVSLGIIFILTTYFPPHWPIFKDAETGLYGIIAHLH